MAKLPLKDETFFFFYGCKEEKWGKYELGSLFEAWIMWDKSIAF